MNLQINPFVLDRGLDAVIRHEPEDAALPSLARLPPSEAASSAELDRLLALPNLHDFVAARLKPALGDPTLLHPTGFQQALTQATTMLERHQRNAALLSGHKNILVSALSVLADERELRDLLRAYRNAMQQA